MSVVIIAKRIFEKMFQVVTVASLVLLAVDAAQGNPCEAAEQTGNLQGCIKAMTDVLEDTSQFWFGTGYPNRCPVESRDSLDCYTALPDPGYGFSLGQRVFGNDFNSSTINMYPFVTYSRNTTEQYEACEHSYEHGPFSESMYPLDGESYGSLITSVEPSIQLGSNVTESHTVIFLDPETLRLHGLWTNSTASAAATMEIAYREPLNFRSVGNPFIFIAYLQTGQVTLNDDWRAIVDDPEETFDLSAFVSQYGLEGPVGVNWVSVVADPYGIQKLREAGKVENCASLVTESLQTQTLSFANPSETLPVHLSVHMTTTSFHYTYCCEAHYFTPRVITLDPIGNGSLDPAEIRTDAVDFTLIVQKNKVEPDLTTDFTGQNFTILVGDISVPFAAAGTRDLPLLHWLVTNMQVDPSSGALTGGQTVQPYRGPMPPDEAPHFYIFLLYRQPDMLAAVDASRYTGGCSSRLVGRCLFDVSGFATEESLELVSASWIVSENNDYVSYANGLPENATCVGREGYSDPCDITDQATRGLPNVCLSILLLLVVRVLA